MSELALAVDQPGTTAADMALAKQVGDTLTKQYPNHLWLVTIAGGMVQVRNVNLSGKWGFAFKATDVFSATDLDKRLMRAAGEVLERFRLSREKMSAERVTDKVMALNTDFAGNTVFDK